MSCSYCDSPLYGDKCQTCGGNAPSNANTSGLAPTDALRLVPIDMQIESILHDLVEEVSAAQRGARVKARARQCCARGAAKNALLNILAAAPASPLPGGGPYERWSILNHLGESWTPENFNTERQATAYLDGWKRDNPKMDLSRHKVIPVFVTMTAAPTGDARNGKGEG